MGQMGEDRNSQQRTSGTYTRNQIFQHGISCSFRFQGSVFCLSLNRRVLVSGSFDHSVCVWDRLSGGFDLIKRLVGTHQDMVYGVAVNNQDYILRYPN